MTSTNLNIVQLENSQEQKEKAGVKTQVCKIITLPFVQAEMDKTVAQHYICVSKQTFCQ
jgi:hypothetical protein